MTREEKKALLRAQQGELDAVLLYESLAEKVGGKDAAVFRQLAREEGQHALVFQELTGEKHLVAKKKLAKIVLFLYAMLGRKRVYRLIAKGEYKAEELYRPLIATFPSIEQVAKDEKRHGDLVSSLLK